MVEQALDWIAKHYPALILAIIAAAGTWFFARLYFRWTARIKKTEESCDTILPQLALINGSLTSITGSFNNLVIHLATKDGNVKTAKLFTIKSPIQLTEFGERILKAIGGKDFVDTYLAELIKTMEAYGIKTALDSQTYAPVVISLFSNKETFNPIKNFIFFTPNYKEINNDGSEISAPLDMGTITNIMGIYLRDKYLEKRPDLKAEDIPDVALTVIK